MRPQKVYFMVFFLIFQDLNLNGNKLARVPTESLRGPEKLTNLDLGDNLIGKCCIIYFYKPFFCFFSFFGGNEN